MGYIVLDLEWNQLGSRHKPRSNKAGIYLKNEVIQIGAVKLNDSFEYIDSFKIAVKLLQKGTLGKRITKITGIGKSDNEQGLGFCVAVKQFRKWCGKGCTYITWGFDDIPILIQNLDYYNMNTDWVKNWFNVQLIYSWCTNAKQRQVGLKNALEQLGVDSGMSFHDALNDARYTAIICSKIDMQRGIELYEVLKEIDIKKISTASYACMVFEDYLTKKEAFSDKELCIVPCPQCNERMKVTKEWLNKSRDKYISITGCKEHGDFLVQLKLIHSKNHDWKVGRIVCKADKSVFDSYSNKVNKQNKYIQNSFASYPI